MSPVFEVYPSSDALYDAAAERFVEQARAAVAARGRFLVALAGGSTPRPLYERLAAPPLRDQVPWDVTRVFWGDERHVPAGDARSNFRMAHETLLQHVPVAERQIHRVPTEHAPVEAAEAYSQLVAEHAGGDGFDLVLLGMGPDGHTASLFPGTEALHADARGAVACYVEKIGAWRITLTLPEINQAKAVVFLVRGADKASAAVDVRSGHSALPAERVAPPAGAVRWMVDAELADAARTLRLRSSTGSATAGSGATSDAAKRRAGEAAAEEVHGGMSVGLGTGSTARFVVEALGRRLAAGDLGDIVCVPTSVATAQIAQRVRLPLTTLDAQPRLDVTIDGADEISPTLDLVKGLGAALVREKIVAAASDRLVIVADEGKLVDRLGTRAPLPVAVVPFAWEVHLDTLRALGSDPVLRRTDDGTPVTTDDGLYLLDCRFADGIADPAALQRELVQQPGIVDTGLFAAMADSAYVADATGLTIYRRR